MSEKFLSLENIEKRFPIPGQDDYVAVTDINLEIKENEIISIIGHSGCGKSTLLNIDFGFRCTNFRKYSSPRRRDTRSWT